MKRRCPRHFPPDTHNENAPALPKNARVVEHRRSSRLSAPSKTRMPLKEMKLAKPAHQATIPVVKVCIIRAPNKLVHPSWTRPPHRRNALARTAMSPRTRDRVPGSAPTNELSRLPLAAVLCIPHSWITADNICIYYSYGFRSDDVLVYSYTKKLLERCARRTRLLSTSVLTSYTAPSLFRPRLH